MTMNLLSGKQRNPKPHISQVSFYRILLIKDCFHLLHDIRIGWISTIAIIKKNIKTEISIHLNSSHFIKENKTFCGCTWIIFVCFPLKIQVLHARQLYWTVIAVMKKIVSWITNCFDQSKQTLLFVFVLTVRQRDLNSSSIQSPFCTITINYF